MVNVKEIKVENKFSTAFLHIEVVVEDAIDLDSYEFDLLRSEVAFDEFNLIAEDIQDFTYRDFDVNLLNPALKYFYKCLVIKIIRDEISIENEGLEDILPDNVRRVIDIPDYTDYIIEGNKIIWDKDSEDIPNPGELYLIEADIIEDFEISDVTGSIERNLPAHIMNVLGGVLHIHDVYLNFLGNTQMLLLTRKRYGVPCTKCWDDVREQVTDDKCSSCYGTGYVGGYYKPVGILVNYGNPQFQTQISYNLSDVAEDYSLLQLWTSNYPEISAGDILVDDQGKRFEVKTYSPTMEGGVLIRQVLNVSYLPPSNVAYEVAVEWPE